METLNKKNNHLRIVRGNSKVIRILFDERLGNSPCLICNRPGDHFTVLKDKPVVLCRHTLHHYHPLAGTAFTGAHVEPLKLWRFLKEFCYRPMSSADVAFNYGWAETTAAYMLERARIVMKAHMDTLKFTGDKPIEADETGQLTGNKGMGRHFIFRKGRGSRRTTTLLLLIERGGGIAKLFICQSQGFESLYPIIEENVPKHAEIYTDEWKGYSQLIDNGYLNHQTCNHSKGQFTNGKASTNTCEHFFSYYKKKISGAYNSISYHHLPLYNAEFCFRYTYSKREDKGFQIFLDSLPRFADVHPYNKAS